jgi:hypothetical protein
MPKTGRRSKRQGDPDDDDAGGKASVATFEAMLAKMDNRNTIRLEQMGERLRRELANGRPGIDYETPFLR